MGMVRHSVNDACRSPRRTRSRMWLLDLAPAGYAYMTAIVSIALLLFFHCAKWTPIKSSELR